jgi:hypothetical protein
VQAGLTDPDDLSETLGQIPHISCMIRVKYRVQFNMTFSQFQLFLEQGVLSHFEISLYLL